MIINTHTNQEGQKITAMIDEELLNKKIETEELQLDFTSNFYKGKKIDEKNKEEEKELFKEIETSYMIIAAGEKTINFLKEKNIIKEEDIKKIKNVPFVYILARKE